MHLKKETRTSLKVEKKVEKVVLSLDVSIDYKTEEVLVLHLKRLKVVIVWRTSRIVRFQTARALIEQVLHSEGLILIRHLPMVPTISVIEEEDVPRLFLHLLENVCIAEPLIMIIISLA